MNISPRIIDLQDIPNNKGTNLPDYNARKQSDDAKPFKITKGLIIILCVVITAIAILFIKFAYYLGEVNRDTQWVDTYLLLAIKLSPVAAILLLLYWLYNRARRSGVIRLQNDFPIWTGDVQRGWQRDRALAVMLNVLGNSEHTQKIWAQQSTYRNLNTLDASRESNQLPSGILEPNTDLILPPDQPKLIDDRDWLMWIDSLAHVMLAGRTDSGKTTFAKALISNRQDELVIIDPHDQPNKWFGYRAIGGGRNFAAILAYLAVLVKELDKRYEDYNAGKPTEDFTRLTILVDEVPALVAYCEENKDKRWSSFARALGSEARKVRMNAILLTQSTLVQDIGINTAMRENFIRIGLGDQSSRLLSEESNSKRRQQLSQLLKGSQYTAVIEYRNEINILDTTHVPDLARRQPTAALWTPQQITPPVVPIGNGYKAVDNETLKRLLMLSQYRDYASKLTTNEAKDKVIRAMRKRGFLIREIRDVVQMNTQHVTDICKGVDDAVSTI